MTDNSYTEGYRDGAAGLDSVDAARLTRDRAYLQGVRAGSDDRLHSTPRDPWGNDPDRTTRREAPSIPPPNRKDSAA
jgi:hypothetical protein